MAKTNNNRGAGKTKKVVKKNARDPKAPGKKIGALNFRRIMLNSKIRKNDTITGICEAALDNVQQARGLYYGQEAAKPMTLRDWSDYLLQLDLEREEAAKEVLVIQMLLEDEGWDVDNGCFFPDDEEDDEANGGFDGDVGGGGVGGGIAA